jgi:hypothetical protein
MTAEDPASHTVARGCCLSAVSCSQTEAWRIAHVLPLITTTLSLACGCLDPVDGLRDQYLENLDCLRIWTAPRLDSFLARVSRYDLG